MIKDPEGISMQKTRRTSSKRANSDRSSDQASRFLYQRVVEGIESQVRSGNYRPGQKLPGMKQLSSELGVSYLTVRQGLMVLQEKGFLRISHGAGTFVADRPFAQKKNDVIRLGIACRSYMLQAGEHHPMVGAALAGAHRRCKPPEFMLQPLFYDEGRFQEEIGQLILSEGISGVIILAGGMRDKDYDFLCSNQIHAVSCAEELRRDGWAMTVSTEKTAALQQSIEHLRVFGHNRIAFISFAEQTQSEKVKQCFRQLAYDHRLGNPAKLMVMVGSTHLQTHWEDVEEFFEIDPLPTAVIVSDGFLADVLLDGCERRNIDVPEQLSIVALQDSKPQAHRIPLTTPIGVDILEQKIYKAADLLARRIAGELPEHLDVAIPLQLHIKASSAPVRKDEPAVKP